MEDGSEEDGGWEMGRVEGGRGGRWEGWGMGWVKDGSGEEGRGGGWQ